MKKYLRRNPWRCHERLARSLEGDFAAVRSVAKMECSEGAWAGDRSLWPALDLSARLHSSKGRALVRPACWRRALLESSARWIGFDEAVDQLARELSREGVDWLPIKGFDVGTHYYPQREARWLSDVDILLHARDLDRAKRALESAGWQSLYQGEAADDYLRSEGYCWPVVSSEGVLVEIHTRFWGLVPSGFEAMVLDRSELDTRHQKRRHPDPAVAWMIAAVHSWLDPAPRSLSGLCDLELIIRNQTKHHDRRGSEFTAALYSLALEWELQLPCALSSEAAWRLFKNPSHRQLADQLQGSLRHFEKRILQRLVQRGIDSITLAAIVRARLLGRRRSRAGLRSVFRHLWAHPAIVERETAEGRAFWIRRLVHLTRHWRRRYKTPIATRDTPATALERSVL